MFQPLNNPQYLRITAKSRNVGILQVGVYTAKDGGEGQGGDIAQFAGRIFRRQVRSVTTEGTVTYKDPTTMSMGTVRGRNMQVVRVP